MNKKYNLLIPIAGRGSRFLNEGYVLPKPLITVSDKQIIDWSMASINTDDCNLIFVVRQDHIDKFSIDQVLQQKYGNVEIYVAQGDTDGTVSSCLLARHSIDNSIPLIIYTLDVHFQPVFDPNDVPKNLNGCILSFKANNPAYSYMDIGADGLVTKTAEKEVISQHAAAGIYYFQRGADFVWYADSMVERNLRTKNEFYVCPLYNLLIEKGMKIGHKEVRDMYVMGTPAEAEFFKQNVLRSFTAKPIAICSDHSGFEAKEIFKRILTSNGLEYIDFGTYSPKACDYSDYVPFCAQSVLEKTSDYGVAFCRTGQGVNMTANKIDGIRSALIYDEHAAECAISHNAANFFAIPSKISDFETLDRFVGIWRKATFEGGRHSTRLSKIR